ncbi:hypothetical protein [Streptomyces roseolus]|uniref:hypothetical protein n=1 Tax=Streptomyces roseolus TaxID=67358 RepID=UPI001678DE92|nr:hypothetical protein [Streptomyces roseolus]GGR51911.1 hypothetical protein GCM10010282_51070 [Streptomyces roseolus]
MRVISGAVTHNVTQSRRHNHNTPHWLKAVYAVIVGIVVIVALSLMFAPSGGTLPACEWEDGSGNPGAPCLWDSDSSGDRQGRDVLHYNGQVFVEAK